MKRTTLVRTLGLLSLALGLAACDSETAREMREELARPIPPTVPDAPVAIPVFGLGQPGSGGGVQLTITDVTTPSRLFSHGSGLSTEPGETFVVVSFMLKNVGDAPLAYLERPAITLIDGRGRTYDPDSAATSEAAIWGMTEPSGYSADLNPNVSAKTKLAWKLDKNAFDRGTWRLGVATSPRLTFALR